MPSETESRAKRAEEAHALEEDARLRNDIRLLGRILGDTVRDQEGADVFDLVERIRQISIRFHRDDDEQWKNYSISRDWVKDFSDFCLRSKGFQIF